MASIPDLINYGQSLFAPEMKLLPNTSKIKVIDFFCGAGLFSYGFLRAGYEVIAGVDKWKGCKDTFLKNHPGSEFICVDIVKLQAEIILGPQKESILHLWIEDSEWFLPVPDIVIGSPPCNNASKANRNRDFKKAMICIDAYMRLIAIIQPRYWIMENVGDTEQLIKEYYPRVETSIINAADFGVPQERERCFAGVFPRPKPTRNNSYTFDQRTLEGKLFPRKMTAWNAIKDLLYILENDIDISIPNLIATNSSQKSMRYKLYECNFGMQKRYRLFALNGPFPVQTDMHGDSLIFPRKLYLQDRFLTNNSWSPNYNGAIRNFRTITTIAQYILVLDEITGEKVILRRLTARETARAQGIPDIFIFEGSKKDIDTMIGNAVVPLVSYNFAKSLAKLILTTPEE